MEYQLCNTTEIPGVEGRTGILLNHVHGFTSLAEGTPRAGVVRITGHGPVLEIEDTPLRPMSLRILAREQKLQSVALGRDPAQNELELLGRHADLRHPALGVDATAGIDTEADELSRSVV